MATTLEYAGESIENPTEADLARALQGPRDDDWYLTLNRGDDSMEAMIDAGELWVEVTEGTRFLQARSRLDEPIVRSMLASFRDGDHGWRDMALWKEPAPRKKDTVKGPTGVALGFVAVFVALLVTWIVTGRDGWMVVAFTLILPGIITVAAVVKIGEVKRAASWSKATGRIVRAEMVTQQQAKGRVEVPLVEYEYKVGFHTLVGKRVNFAEIVSGPEAKAMLARYPVGTAATVYYDPANPSDSVIERDLPPFVHAVWGVVAVLLAAIAFGAWWNLIR